MFILFRRHPRLRDMKVYLVGGAVRDSLLGIEPEERDWVVVGANDATMLANGYRRVGRDFPVYLHPQTNEQYALARRERKSGRGYTGFAVEADEDVTLEQDLMRRDLTVNAIARDETGILIDPFHGQRDIAERVLRHVSPAFNEDPLRVLRVARFAARFAPLGFRVAEETMALMRAMGESGELEFLVAERVWVETERALASAAPQEYLRVLRECGALAVVFPEIDRLFGVPQPARHHPEIDTGEHMLLCLGVAARMQLSPRARFALLTHDLGKGLTPREEWPSHILHEQRGAEAVGALCERLGVPAKWRSLALQVCLHHTRCHRLMEMRPPAIVRLLSDLDVFRNPEPLEDFLAACEADARGRTGCEDASYPQAQRLRSAYTAARAITAEAAVARGLQGAAIASAMHQQRVAAVAQQLGMGIDDIAD
jgi:tRNA nucleotidyltransferase (CCA-adding enzyme)